jgi:dUTP pyrophosphatase
MIKQVHSFLIQIYGVFMYQTNISSTIETVPSIEDVFTKLYPDAVLPSYQHEDDSGMDICAYIPDGNIIIPGQQGAMIPTGITANLPYSKELQVRSRSGLASKFIFVVNSPGTVDEGYKYVDEQNKAEIKVILFNLIPGKDFVIEHGMRIAQLVYANVLRLRSPLGHQFKQRVGKGFGSTGV